MSPRHFPVRIATVASLLATLQAVAANPSSDFDDGTLQGWTNFAPTGGDILLQVMGGNPGGFLLAIDTQGGGPFPRTIGPASFSGDLGIYDGLQWDEFIFDNGPQVVRSTRPLLIGTNGTVYMHGTPFGPIGVWNTRYVSFDPDDWFLRDPGPSSFEEVLHNGTVGFSLDTSDTINQLDCGIDNVTLIGGPTSEDCNANGIPDDDDIQGGTSLDCTRSGVPDECELLGEDCPVLAGDISNDGRIDRDDVTQFITVLTGLNQCHCSVLAADLNGDGAVDDSDIWPFIVVVNCNLDLHGDVEALFQQPVEDLLRFATMIDAPLDLGQLLRVRVDTRLSTIQLDQRDGLSP